MARQTQLTPEQKAENRRIGAIYKNRRHSHARKGAQLHTLCGAQIYIVWEYKGRISTFTAKTKPNWPPSKEELVSEIPPKTHRLKLIFCRKITTL